MNKKSKIIIGVFIVVLIAIIGTEIGKPKPIDWTPSYTSYHTKPFGSYVLYNEINALFSKDKVHKITNNVFTQLQLNNDSSSNYIFINSQINLDKTSTNALLKYVHAGNNVFIAATNLGEQLKDTLKTKLKSVYTINEDTVTYSFTNTRLSNTQYRFNKGSNKSHFYELDTLNTEVLGYINYTSNSYSFDNLNTPKEESQPNFINTKFGDGHFYIHSSPIAFSNYYLLNGNHGYASKALSYLPNINTYWDDYEKAGRTVINSPMRFILMQPALKWAYYLGVGGLLLFMIFKAKREQRIIPVIKPQENTSVSFAKTIGTLYFQHNNYTNLSKKKSSYFLAFLRAKYYVNTNKLDITFAKQLALKSGNHHADVEALVALLNKIQNNTSLTQEDLLELNRKILKFKK